MISKVVELMPCIGKGLATRPVIIVPGQAREADQAGPRFGFGSNGLSRLIVGPEHPFRKIDVWLAWPYQKSPQMRRPGRARLQCADEYDERIRSQRGWLRPRLDLVGVGAESDNASHTLVPQYLQQRYRQPLEPLELAGNFSFQSIRQVRVFHEP